MFNSFHCIPVSYVSFPFFLSIQVQSIVAVSFFLAIFKNHPLKSWRSTSHTFFIFIFKLNVLYLVPCTVYRVQCTPSASWQFNPFQEQTLFLILSVLFSCYCCLSFYSKTNEALAWSMLYDAQPFLWFLMHSDQVLFFFFFLFVVFFSNCSECGRKKVRKVRKMKRKKNKEKNENTLNFLDYNAVHWQCNLYLKERNERSKRYKMLQQGIMNG